MKNTFNKRAVFAIAGLMSAVAFHASSAEQPVTPQAATAVVVANPDEELVAAAQVSSFNDLAMLAQSMSYHAMTPRPDAPPELAALSYEDYMTIRYKHGDAYWSKSKSPFLMETFHQGFVQKDRITLFEQTTDGNVLVPFDPERFHYNDVSLDSKALAVAVKRAGHAGLRLVERVENENLQEVITFLGASYFRARSHDTFYGTSARGLAVDIALPTEEDFPRFRTFWVRRPFPGDDFIHVKALLDSPSCTGAYEFHITPGESRTSVNVHAEIFLRADGINRKYGLAPLTSMWLWGDGLPGASLDNRPHVHDSSALVIQATDATTMYRPLARIAYPSVSRYPVDGLVRFGLVQRDRDPKHYLDTNAHYEDRPSVIITPSIPWTDGVVELFEIPGAHEGIDNIGAYWVPNQMPAQGEPFELSYNIAFTSESLDVLQTDAGEDDSITKLAKIEAIDVKRRAGGIDLTAHLVGDSLESIDPNSVQMQIATVRGEVRSQSVTRIGEDSIDATITLVPTEDAPIEITVAFRVDDEAIAETLSYLCPQSMPNFVFPAVYTKVE